MREYVRKSSGIPKSVQARVKALLSDYDRMRRLRIDMLYASAPPPTGMPRGSGVGNPTEQRAIVLSTITDELEAIDQASVVMRGERSAATYEEFDPIRGYWDYNYFNYQHIRTPQSPNGPSTRTWHRYKDQFTKLVAIKLKFF